MNFYLWNLAVLVLLNTLLASRDYKEKRLRMREKDAKRQVIVNDATENLRLFKWRFFPVYLLVNAADWLQGPYIYPLYKDEKRLAEEVVAALFMTGFIAGALSASFVGKLADRFGRRLACLAFCVIYSVSCLVLFSDNIIVLFIGRSLGGIGTTILYSCFESWMVTEYNALSPDELPSTLSGIFSTMTTLNTVVAVLAGILAEWAADMAGTQKAPFMGAVVCLALAFIAIWRNWGENYGAVTDVSLSLEGKKPPPPKNAIQLFLHDKRLIALGLTSAVFEGSMYVFIFFKFPAMKQSHKLAGLGNGEDLPFGLIFAILMCSMMAGSMIHKYVVTHALLDPTSLLVTTLAIAATSFGIPVLIRNEYITFWSFCVFEVCCGIYFPLMAYQKGQIIDDSVRANVYGVMRVPLNIFVVLILSTTKEGPRHRDLIFMVCDMLLLCSTAVTGVLL